MARPIDVGPYHLDAARVEELEAALYRDHPPVTLPPEYAEWTKENLLRFLIRLARYKFVARMLREKDRVLEVGSGSGLGAIFLAQHAAHVTGLEVRQHEHDEATELNRRENVEFVCEDFHDHSPSQPYDAVVALDVIEHLDDAGARALLARMRDVAAPTGMVVIGTPSFFSWEHQSEVSRASHVHCYRQEELLALMDEYFGRTLPFSMNDELVHTGHPTMAWYYFALAFCPRTT